MAVPQEILWPIGPHTKAKHEILKKYLQRWFPILNKYYKRVVYIDGFCGPGRYEGGELGSPLIALKAALSTICAIFIKNNLEKKRSLLDILKCWIVIAELYIIYFSLVIIVLAM